MNIFINYIIESGISLGMFSLIYFVFLRNETFFRANRLFLLFAVVFSTIIPLLQLKIFQPDSLVFSQTNGAAGGSNMLESVTIYGSDITGSLVGFITDSRIIVWGYLLIVFVCALLLAFRIAQIIKVIRTSEVVQKTGIKFVYINEDSSPYSFLSYLFVSRNLEKMPGWEKMLAHESEHIRQRHTVDILILELISLFQWFNPFFWMMRRVIKENHEYMADQAVLNKGVPIDLYKQILVSQWVGNQFTIANNFNSSLIKLRLKMMTKMKSSKLAGLRYLSGAIMAAALVLVFACENKKHLVSGNEIKIQGKSIQLSETKNAPLFVIDGKLSSQDAFRKIKPDDLKSVTAMKENANLIVKYGEKAKNGVIYVFTKDSETKSTDKDVFFIVEEMPKFPGGEEALRTYITQNVKYPEIAQKNGIQGKVYVSFVVEKDGSVDQVKIARGVDPSLNEEALRVVTSFPKWLPGKQKGEAVAVQYTVPVNFVLQ